VSWGLDQRAQGRQSVKGSPNENSSSEHERSPVLALHDNPEFRSVLEVIVEHEVEEFAENELFNQIITEKYQHFGRRMHIRTRAIPYVLYVILHAVYVILRTREVIERTELFGLEGASVPKMLPPDVAGLYNWIGGNPQIGQNTPLFYCSRVCETGLLLWTTALFYYGWKERRLTPRCVHRSEPTHRAPMQSVCRRIMRGGPLTLTIYLVRAADTANHLR
jgi:hypothetical protein